jgi:hypothetical protein
MTEYFAVMDEDGRRRGPFDTKKEAADVLWKIAMERGYTDEQADQLLLHESAIVRVETKNGEVALFNLGWPLRNESSSLEIPAEKRNAMPEKVMAKAPRRPTDE